ncbi:leucyl aminopeptidase [Okibacterium endophyticum]
MTVSEMRISHEPARTSDADVILLGALRGGKSPSLHAHGDFARVGESLASIGVRGGQDEVTRIPAVDGVSAGSIAIVGIGDEPTPDALRYAAGSAIRQLTGVGHVAIALAVSSVEELSALLEGAALGSYAFTAYRKDSLEGTMLPPRVITVHIDASIAEADVIASTLERSRVVAEAVARVKDLVNTPPIDLYPQTLAEHAVDAAAGLPVEVKIWDEHDLAADGFGGILGVGQGSSRSPRLVKVIYAPSEASSHLALVGKGITFDTGGLSLKPAAGMLGMKYDMTGAATVLAVVVAAAKLGLPVRLTAWMCIAENMPSGTAIRPNDVLRIRGGKTVEVTNTDAEGRLVMADGLVAASEEHPDAIIDIATLTGAASVALGKRYAAVMGDDDMIDRVRSAAIAAGERFWAMPEPAELKALLRSDVADLANAKVGNSAGGMLLAGIFLREFVGRVDDSDDAATIPWAHLDIAGPANNPDSPFGFTGKGPSGVGVRALLAVAESYAHA